MYSIHIHYIYTHALYTQIYIPETFIDIYISNHTYSFHRPGDQDSIPGRVIPKTQKIVLGAALLNTQHFKDRIKGKVEQSREWSSTLPYTSV